MQDCRSRLSQPREGSKVGRDYIGGVPFSTVEEFVEGVDRISELETDRT
jgi:hypothetical protein